MVKINILHERWVGSRTAFVERWHCWWPLVTPFNHSENHRYFLLFESFLRISKTAEDRVFIFCTQVLATSSVGHGMTSYPKWTWPTSRDSFLANVTLRLRSVYAIARPSVVGNACAPYSGGWNFRQYFYRIWYFYYPLISTKKLRRSSQRNPFAGGVKHKRGSQI